jgi:hypothetical protein
MSTVTTIEFNPSNRLEVLLSLAAQDPTRRPCFYRELLDNDVYMLVVYDEIGIRIQSVKRDAEEIIPLFSSLARLEEFTRATGLEDYKHDHGSGREVLTILETAHIILNPISNHQKTFKPPEIRGILDGSYMKKAKIIKLDGEQESLYSIPDPYPDELVNDLKASFAFSKLVRTAYLVQVHQDNRMHPQLVIGLEADEGYIAAEPAEIAMESLGEDEFISFIKLGADSLSIFMIEKTKPIYEREED